MTVQLRCDGLLYGVISDDGMSIEVRCKKTRCGFKPGVIILHTMSLKTGKVTSTRRFTDPAIRKV